MEIHRVDQSCSENEENLIESNTRKRQGSARKNIMKTHRGEDSSESNQGKENLIESDKKK